MDLETDNAQGAQKLPPNVCPRSRRGVGQLGRLALLRSSYGPRVGQTIVEARDPVALGDGGEHRSIGSSLTTTAMSSRSGRLLIVSPDSYSCPFRWRRPSRIDRISTFAQTTEMPRSTDCSRYSNTEQTYEH
jgi:hypothetical protein